MILKTVVDGFGVYGNYLHFAMVVFFVGSALLIFVYLWRHKRLDMDEEPKHQMMESDASEKEEHHE